MNWILSKLFPVKRLPYADRCWRVQRTNDRFYSRINDTFGEFPRLHLLK